MKGSSRGEEVIRSQEQMKALEGSKEGRSKVSQCHQALEEVTADSHATAAVGSALCPHPCIHGQVSAGTGLLGPAQPQVHAAVRVLVGTGGVVSVRKWPQETCAGGGG